MTEPRAGLERGYYLLNTDGGMASNGRRRSGAPLGRAAIGALLRTRRLVTVDQISKAIGPATHNVAEYLALIKGLKLARDYGIQRIRRRRLDRRAKDALDVLVRALGVGW